MHARRKFILSVIASIYGHLLPFCCWVLGMGICLTHFRFSAKVSSSNLHLIAIIGNRNKEKQNASPKHHCGRTLTWQHPRVVSKVRQRQLCSRVFFVTILKSLSEEGVFHLLSPSLCTLLDSLVSHFRIIFCSLAQKIPSPGY